MLDFWSFGASCDNVVGICRYSLVIKFVKQGFRCKQFKTVIIAQNLTICNNLINTIIALFT